MKTTKFSKIAVLVVAMALLVGAICAISVSADDSEVTLDIDSGNVVYSDMLQLAFTLDGKAPEGAEVGVMVWDVDTENPDESNYSYATLAASELDGVTYYKTPGVAATNIDKEIIVSACYRLNGKLYAVEKKHTYSIAEYAGTRLTEQITANQSSLYERLIKYALASDNVIGTDDVPVVKNYAFVEAVNGVIENYSATIGGWSGLPVLLRAEAKNAAGKYFIGWQNEAGETVSNNRLYTVTAPESGIDTYTAVYGDAANSMYATTVDLEQYVTGALISGAKTGWSIAHDASGTFYITESLTGDKELRFDRTVTQKGGNVAVTNIPAGAIGFELDVAYEAYNVNNNLHHVTFIVSDGTTEISVRFLNIYHSKDGYLYFQIGDLDAKNVLSVTKEDATATYKLYAGVGETVSLGFVFEKTETAVEGEEGTVDYGYAIKLYINGEYINSYDMETQVEYFFGNANFASFDISKTITLTKASLNNYYALADDFRVDNMTFFTEYKN